MIWLKQIICEMGGRKYFYCTFWLLVATGLRIFKLIESYELIALMMWFFTNVVVANNREAVAEIKAKSIEVQVNANSDKT